MPTVLVNSRVDEQLKKSAEKVLAASNTTTSEVIRRLFEQIVQDQSVPGHLTNTEPSPIDVATSRRRMRELAGIIKSDRLSTDESTARVMEEEMMRRYGQ